jgi:hypothetical protein
MSPPASEGIQRRVGYAGLNRHLPPPPGRGTNLPFSGITATPTDDNLARALSSKATEDGTDGRAKFTIVASTRS